jgi:hypothetical protein
MAKRDMCPLEWQEQRYLIQWLKLMPAISRHVVKITNEGDRTAQQGYYLQTQGMCSGASDLFLAYPVNGVPGFWLEIKRAKHYPPSETSRPVWVRQQKFQQMMRDVGYEAQTAFGWLEAKAMIERYLINGRALRDEPDTASLP